MTIAIEIKMGLANIKCKLSRAEMKTIIAGNAGFEGCKLNYDTECAVSGTGDPDDLCCSGLKCEMKASNTGTICI
jgi:hypothetical protein